MDLDGTRFLISGATGELGALLAHELHGRGVVVGLLGRDGDRLSALADDLGGAPTAVFEATEAGSCAAAVDAVAAGLGGLDGCLVAHGVAAFGAAQDTDDETARTLMLVNAVSAMAVLRAGQAHMESGGSLAAITAIVSDFPTAGLAAYSASKAALSAYLTALRREVRRSGAHVLDARLPHLDTGFSERALAGQPPKMPPAHSAAAAAAAVIDAIAGDRAELRWDLEKRTLVAS